MTTPSLPVASKSGKSNGSSSIAALAGNVSNTKSDDNCGTDESNGLPLLQNLPAGPSKITSTTTSNSKGNNSSNKNSSTSDIVKTGSKTISNSNSTICHFLDLPSPSLARPISKPLSITTTDTMEPDSCASYIGLSGSGSLFATSSSSSTSPPPAVTTIMLSPGSGCSSSSSNDLSLPPSVYHQLRQKQKKQQQQVQSSIGCLKLDIEDVNVLRQHHQSLSHCSDEGAGNDGYDLPSPTITSTMMMLPPPSNNKQQQQKQQQQQQLQQAKGSTGGGGSLAAGCGSGSSNSSCSSSPSSAINTVCETSEFFSKGNSKDSGRSSVDDESKVLPDMPDSSKRPFVPCKVCGDKASGYHYGVTSCEGCKGFFRRSIQKQIEYRCLRDGKCMIIRLNRNRCQYCRFKKCLAVGMSRDSVRYGRVPKRSRSVEDHSVSSTDSSQDQSAVESKQLAIYDIILNISQAHHAHCAITEDKIKNIPRNPASLRSKIRIPQGQVIFTNEELEMQRLYMWQQLAYLITPSIHSVVEFSKRVPNFSELSQDDQLILIKTGFFEIWLIRMSRMILKQDGVVVFENGSCIPRDELAVVYAPDFVTSMFEMVSNFNLLNLNDTEIGLFTGIVLTTADRQGLSDPSSVERTQDQLVEALQLQISRSHSTEENLFASIIMKAPELRTLGSRHNDLLRWYRSQWHRISLPPLFAEIYDIPKNPIDAQSQ